MAKQKYIPSVLIDKESTTPLHVQITEGISQEIFKDRPAPGTPVISQRQFADMIEVNRITVNRAYKKLFDDGILIQPPKKKNIYIAPSAFDKVRPPFPVIGIILPCPYSEFISTVDQTPQKYMSGLLDRTAEKGYAPMLLNPPPPGSSDDVTRRWLDDTISRLTALIHLGRRINAEDRPLEIILKETYLPQIFVSGHSDDSRIGTVCCDIESGLSALAAYLKERGHTRIGVIGDVFDPPHFFRYTYSMRTERGVRCFRNAGMELRDDWILRIPLEQSTRPLLDVRVSRNPNHLDWLSQEDGFLETKAAEMLEKCGSHLPSVFWCSNDFLAIRFCNFLRNKGFRIPQDFSVVGTDGNRESEFAEVPLTTIGVPMYEIGRLAIDMALDHFFNGVNEENRVRKLPSILTVRQSVRDLKTPRSYIAHGRM